MVEKEKKIFLEWEEQGWNMCSEASFVPIAKKFNKRFDMNKDGEFNQWDVPLIHKGECTYFWDMGPCFNEILNCKIQIHRNIDELIEKVDEDMPTMIRIRPRGNLPGEHHSVVVVGYKIGKNGKRTVLLNDPAVGKFIEISENRLKGEWKASKNAAMMCKRKEE